MKKRCIKYRTGVTVKMRRHSCDAPASDLMFNKSYYELGVC